MFLTVFEKKFENFLENCLKGFAIVNNSLEICKWGHYSYALSKPDLYATRICQIRFKINVASIVKLFLGSILNSIVAVWIYREVRRETI
jgi:hypothetical protein